MGVVQSFGLRLQRGSDPDTCNVAPLLVSSNASKSDKWGVTRMDETAHSRLSNILNTQSAGARRRNSASHEPSRVRSRSTVEPSKVR